MQGSMFMKKIQRRGLMQNIPSKGDPFKEVNKFSLILNRIRENMPVNLQGYVQLSVAWISTKFSSFVLAATIVLQAGLCCGWLPVTWSLMHVSVNLLGAERMRAPPSSQPYELVITSSLKSVEAVTENSS